MQSLRSTRRNSGTKKRIINILVAAEAVRRSGTHERWLPALTALTGSPWPDRTFSAARTFTAARWSAISLVAAELMFARYASVSREHQFRGHKTDCRPSGRGECSRRRERAIWPWAAGQRG